MNFRLAATLAALILALSPASLLNAHPLAQGSFVLVVFPDHISLWARVSVEQVMVQLLLPTRDDDKVETPSQVYKSHGDYFLKHVFVKADDKLLSGKVIAITEPTTKAIHPLDSQNEFVTYEIEYPLNAKPGLIELSQNVLNEVDFVPGNRWEATYVTSIRQEQNKGLENMMLTSKISVPFSCDWSAPPESSKPVTQPSTPPPELKTQMEEKPRRMDFVLGALIGAGAVAVIGILLKKKFARKSEPRP